MALKPTKIIWGDEFQRAYGKKSEQHRNAIRRALRMMLPTDVSKPWMRYSGMVETGDPTSSRTVDDVVYG